MLKVVAKNILINYLRVQHLKKEIKKSFNKKFKKAPITVKENRIKTKVVYEELGEDLRIVQGFIFKRLVEEALNEEGIKISASSDAWYFRGIKRRISRVCEL